MPSTNLTFSATLGNIQADYYNATLNLTPGSGNAALDTVDGKVGVNSASGNISVTVAGTGWTGSGPQCCDEACNWGDELSLTWRCLEPRFRSDLTEMRVTGSKGRYRLRPATALAILTASSCLVSTCLAVAATVPERFGAEVQWTSVRGWDFAPNASPAFTPDGKSVYFTHGEGQKRAIMVSHLRKDRWSVPQTAPFSGTWMDIEPALAPDGSYLLFVSNRPTTGGGMVLDGYFGGAMHPGRGGNLWRVDQVAGGGDGVNRSGFRRSSTAPLPLETAPTQANVAALPSSAGLSRIWQTPLRLPPHSVP